MSFKQLFLLEYFYRDGGASNGPRQPCARLSRRLAVPCADRPHRSRRERANRHAGPVQHTARQPGDVAGFAPAEANDPLNNPKLQERNKPAPSRIGQIPKYGLPAASGAADSGYDSLNRKRKKPKY